MSETTIKPYSQSDSLGEKIASTLILRTILAPIILLSSAVLLWAISIPRINPGNMTDLGLVSVLPVTYFLALIVLSISYLASVAQKGANELVLFLHILALIFIIHGTPQIVYGTLRYSWAWKHVGIIDYIMRNGSVDPTITTLNAYHNWPGFFALAAMYNVIAGITTSLAYAGWGPVFFNVIDLGALLVLFKTFTNDKRLVWFSIWIYYMFSWVGQDYFSPQAFVFFLFLVTISVILRWFRRQPVVSADNAKPASLIAKLINRYNLIVNHPLPEDQRIAAANPSQRLFIISFLILAFFVIVSSHQSTPLMLFSGLTLLVLFQVINQKYISILLFTITTAWVIYMAVGFLNGNLYWIVRSIGSLLENVNGNLINLDVASPGQQFIAQIDRMMSAFVWILGIAGLYRRYRSGKWDLPVFLLTIAPIPMMALNSYGGEMIFRVYLFSLPFMAFFAASLFYPTVKSGFSIKTSVFTTLLSFILIPGFLLSYYGKDRMYYFSPNEVAAAEYLYNTAPKGSLIMDGLPDWPKQFSHYEYYNYQSLLYLTPAQRAKILQNPAQVLAQYMDNAPVGSVYINRSPTVQDEMETNLPGVHPGVDYPSAYVIITQSQIAESEMTGSLPAGWSSVITNSLTHSPNFKIVFSNSAAVIFQYVDTAGGH